MKNLGLSTTKEYPWQQRGSVDRQPSVHKPLIYEPPISANRLLAASSCWSHSWRSRCPGQDHCSSSLGKMGFCGLARYSTHHVVSWRKSLDGKQSSQGRAMGVQPILWLGAALNTQKLSEGTKVPIKVIICKLTFKPNQNSSLAKPTYDHATGITAAVPMVFCCCCC